MVQELPRADFEGYSAYDLLLYFSVPINPFFLPMGAKNSK